MLYDLLYVGTYTTIFGQKSGTQTVSCVPKQFVKVLRWKGLSQLQLDEKRDWKWNTLQIIRYKMIDNSTIIISLMAIPKFCPSASQFLCLSDYPF